MAPTPVAIRGADGQTYDDESGADRRSDDDSRRRASVQSSLLLIPDATRFPLEIFEDIIDQMHNDTLPAAAQVCAAWYPRAMRNLYYTVEISTRRRFDMLFKQCRASLRVKQWLATTRELRVTDDTTPNVVGRKNPHFLHAFPPALGHALSRVQCLAICGLRCDMMHETFFLALSQFSSVESLELSLCSLNLSQLRRIIYTFPQLSRLVLYGIAKHKTISYEVEATSFGTPSDIHIRHLLVDMHWTPISLDWIAQSGLCIFLEDLTLWTTDFSQPSVGVLLKTAGSFLTRLRTDYFICDLVHNTALRSLVLDFYGLDLKAQDQGDAMNIVARRSHDILSTVRSHQLEHIEILPGFHMDHLSAPTLERVDLRALHETMSQPHFNALKDVSVKMCLRVSQACHSTSKAQAEDVRQKFEAMFREVLQPWSDRGIIKHFTRGPI